MIHDSTMSVFNVAIYIAFVYVHNFDNIDNLILSSMFVSPAVSNLGSSAIRLALLRALLLEVPSLKN